MSDDTTAFGHPGMPPRWTSSSKEGVGTAYHTASRLWFTLSHGIVNEVYYPSIDQPNTRDIQLLITDGETFVHEERSDLDHELSYPEKGVLAYQLTNSDPEGRYLIHKTVISDPYLPVLLIRHRIEIKDQSLRGKLRFFTLLSPSLNGCGSGNDGKIHCHNGAPLLQASREKVTLVAGALPVFKGASVGYVGKSDGFQDLKTHQDLTWLFDSAPDGNVALTGEHTLDDEGSFILAVGFGGQPSSALTPMLQSLAQPFSETYSRFIRQWSRVRHFEDENEILVQHTGDHGSLYRLSRCILQCHEDKLYQGALIASASIPWGEARGDQELDGYHLVWPRDMLHSSLALLISGQTELPLRSLIYLNCIQRKDGSIPQNCWISGEPYWTGHQLDEVAAPIILAHRLAEIDALKEFDPWPLVSRATAFMLLDGPSTEQERWEENSGYSPSTIATVLAAVMATAAFARRHGDDAFHRLLTDYCDWLQAGVKKWTVTEKGTLDEKIPRHFVRIVPEAGDRSGPAGDPAELTVRIANNGGTHRASDIVDAGFLALVRFGFLDPHDPLVTDSLKLIDRELKVDFPGGPCWRRYNYDGYGSRTDGSAFADEGYGGCWPILTGERGHYELDAGNDPCPHITAMENFANEGGMMPEQIWPLDDVGPMKFGHPAGSAMPLCWSHAEYLSLVHSKALGHPVDRLPEAYERYVKNSPPENVPEFWSPGHRVRRIPAGSRLILLLDRQREVRWRPLGSGDWATEPTEFFTDRLAVLDLGEMNSGLEFFLEDQASPQRIEVG